MESNKSFIRRFWWLLPLAGLVIVAMGLLLSSQGKGANLDVTVVPNDATIVINDEKYKTGKITVPPGTYEIRAEREGFDSATQTITATTKLQPVVFALSPVSEEAQAWAKDHQKDYGNAEALGGAQAQQQAETLVARYPLIEKLPFDTKLYEINYVAKDKSTGTIYIRIDSTSPLGRQVALQQIKDWGFQPADYEIVFPGLRNPLDPKEVPGE